MASAFFRRSGYPDLDSCRYLQHFEQRSTSESSENRSGSICDAGTGAMCSWSVIRAQLRANPGRIIWKSLDIGWTRDLNQKYSMRHKTGSAPQAFVYVAPRVMQVQSTAAFSVF